MKADETGDQRHGGVQQGENQNNSVFIDVLHGRSSAVGG